MLNNTVYLQDSGIPRYNSTSGLFTAVDLTAKGDLLGHSGSAYGKLSVGADGQVLKADSSQSLGWRWACYGAEFISSQTTTGASSVDFTGFADSDCYIGYMLEWQKAYYSGSVPYTFELQFSTDNGSSWLTSGYKYCRTTIRTYDNDELWPASSSSSYISLNGVTGSGTYSSCWNGIGFFYSAIDATNYFKNSFVHESATITNTNNKMITSRGYGLNTTSSAINGFRFRMSSGNIAGTFYLSGILREAP